MLGRAGLAHGWCVGLLLEGDWLVTGVRGGWDQEEPAESLAHEDDRAVGTHGHCAGLRYRFRMTSSDSASTRSAKTQLGKLYRQYFGRGGSASIGDARERLVNTKITNVSYEGNRERYQAAIMDQYKLYVEMADRISARRSLINAFFLTLNTGIFTVIAVFWKNRPIGPAWLLGFPLIALVGQCLAWFWLLRSYRQLNSGKYAVIGALEELLPTSPYWSAEWHVLGEGEDKVKYWPMTHLEQWVPLLFGATYIGAFLAALLTA